MKYVGSELLCEWKREGEGEGGREKREEGVGFNFIFKIVSCSEGIGNSLPSVSLLFPSPLPKWYLNQRLKCCQVQIPLRLIGHCSVHSKCVLLRAPLRRTGCVKDHSGKSVGKGKIWKSGPGWGGGRERESSRGWTTTAPPPARRNWGQGTRPPAGAPFLQDLAHFLRFLGQRNEEQEEQFWGVPEGLWGHAPLGADPKLCGETVGSSCLPLPGGAAATESWSPSRDSESLACFGWAAWVQGAPGWASLPLPG